MKTNDHTINQDDKAEALQDLFKMAGNYSTWRDLCDDAGPHHPEYHHYRDMGQTTAIRVANQLRFCIEQGYL